MAETRKDKHPEPPPVRRGRTTAVGAEANLAAQSAFQRAGFTDPTLILRWSEIAGAETAALTQPVSLKEGPHGGVLTLRAEPGAAVFLQHDSRALCDRINAYLGRPAVARLRFVQGSLTPRAKPAPGKRAAATVPPFDPAQKYQGPEGLRGALLNLARTRRSDP
ncbi:MAG TPA: DciA family protein [Rhizomicrobium sp.]|nr:DciA family protein [Rhizomicrobium sp.]